MATGSITLYTQSVNYDGTRGGTNTSMTNTINWSTSGTTITFSNGGSSGGTYWTIYNSTGAADYLLRLTIQVNYGSGWTDFITKETYIPTVAQGGINVASASNNLVNSLGSGTLSGSCQVRALYYATYEPVPTYDYPNAFPSKTYAIASNPSGVDVNVGPTGISASNIVAGVDSFTATISVTDWGGAGDATTRYRELQAWTGDMTGDRRYQPVYGNTLSGDITVDNNSSGTATLASNTTYTLGMYASNGSANTGSVKIGNYTTLPAAVSVSVLSVTDNRALIHYECPADGNAYNKKIEYSLDNGATWESTNYYTSQDGSLNGRFWITGLSPGTSYTVLTKTTTTVGSTNGATLSFTTGTGKLYGPVRRVADYNWSVDEESKITNFDPQVYINKQLSRGALYTLMESSDYRTIRKLEWTKKSFLSNEWVLMAYWGTGQYPASSQLVVTTNADYDLTQWGITRDSSLSGTSIIYITPSQWTKCAKKIIKLYGAYGVNQEIQLTDYISAFDTDSFVAAIQNYVPGAEFTADKLKAYPNIVIRTDSSSQLSMFFKDMDNNYMKRGAVNMQIIFASQNNFKNTLSSCVTWVAGDSGTSAWTYLTGLTTNTGTQFVTAGFPFVSKLIPQLYGSVNGQTKRIFGGVIN